MRLDEVMQRQVDIWLDSVWGDRYQGDDTNDGVISQIYYHMLDVAAGLYPIQVRHRLTLSNNWKHALLTSNKAKSLINTHHPKDVFKMLADVAKWWYDLHSAMNNHMTAVSQYDSYFQTLQRKYHTVGGLVMDEGLMGSLYDAIQRKLANMAKPVPIIVCGDDAVCQCVIPQKISRRRCIMRMKNIITQPPLAMMPILAMFTDRMKTDDIFDMFHRVPGPIEEHEQTGKNMAKFFGDYYETN